MADFRAVKIGLAKLTLTIGAAPGTVHDVSCAVKSAELTPEIEDEDPVETFCGPISAPSEPTWTLEAELLQDYRADGVSALAAAHAGEEVGFALDMYGSTHTPTADEPKASGTLILAPMSYGGAADEYADSEVSWRVIGQPTFGTTAALAEAEPTPEPV